MNKQIATFVIAAISTAASAQTDYTPLPPVPPTEPFHHYRTPKTVAPVAPVAAVPAVAAPVASPPAAVRLAQQASPARAVMLTPLPVAAALIATRVEAPSGQFAVLPANTEVMLRLDEEVSSKRMRVGDTFRLRVLQDVMLGSYVVIPRGTPASGQISYRTGKGAFGKSAKMEITMDSIQHNGRSIPITGNFREEGQGNTGATVGVAVAAGVFSAFVTGRSATFLSGREFRVATREAMQVGLPD